MPIARPRHLPTVALVGRTNVGKSTLWNRLAEAGHALVSPEAHTTRDRNFGQVVWQGMAFELVDTGGMDVEKDFIGENILQQSERAIAEADLVLFVVDAKSGVTREDQQLANKVKKLHEHVWLVVNKVDKSDSLAGAFDPGFFQLAFGAPHAVSAATSLGIGDLLDDLLAELERIGRPAQPVPEVAPLRIAFIGRPNVGKSSLVNAILGEPRVIVSPVAHTTREPQDTHLRYKDRDLVLVDTAGMRKSSRIRSRVEEQGIERNMHAIEHADVAFLVFDVTEDPSTQDRHLAGTLEEASKGLILVANKWDLVHDKTTGSPAEFETLIRQLFPFLQWAPLVFTSATTNQRTTQLLDLALAVDVERHRHIDYNALNKLLKTCIKAKKPIAEYGPKSPRIYDVAQLGSAPPTFLVTVLGEKESIHPSWVRFFEKRLREKFGFVGTPIVVKVRNVPVAKSTRKHNVHGPGMEAVAGKIKEKKRLVNQTRRRQKR
jgi:GTP-binding protein